MTSSAELEVAVRNLDILEQSLSALHEQLAESNPRLLEVTAEAYKHRVASLKADIEQYRSEAWT